MKYTVKEGSTLSPDLLRGVDRFLKENYTAAAEPLQTGDIKKGKIPEDRDHFFRDFGEQRITLQDGEPVLSEAGSDGAETLENVLEHVGETFQEKLLHLISEKGLTNAEVYGRAHIDRKLFSKIRRDVNYTPRKKNVIALVLALELNSDEAADLLRRAGMALSPGSKSDLIIEYCIRNRIYNINTVNELLDAYGQPILG